MKKIFLLLSLAILPLIMWGKSTSWLVSQGSQIMPVLHENFWWIVATMAVSIVATILTMPPNDDIINRCASKSIIIIILIWLLYQSWQLAVIDAIIILIILLINFLIIRIRNWLSLTTYYVRLLGWKSLWRKSRF